MKKILICVLLLLSGCNMELQNYRCDKLCREVVDTLRASWGPEAQVYWNEQNYVVISKDGYVSEFRRDSTTIHSGFINSMSVAESVGDDPTMDKTISFGEDPSGKLDITISGWNGTTEAVDHFIKLLREAYGTYECRKVKL